MSHIVGQINTKERVCGWMGGGPDAGHVTERICGDWVCEWVSVWLAGGWLGEW